MPNAGANKGADIQLKEHDGWIKNEPKKALKKGENRDVEAVIISSKDSRCYGDMLREMKADPELTDLGEISAGS